MAVKIIEVGWTKDPHPFHREAFMPRRYWVRGSNGRARNLPPSLFARILDLLRERPGFQSLRLSPTNPTKPHDSECTRFTLLEVD